MSDRKVHPMLKFAPLAVLGAALFGWGVMALWNWITPDLFGWKPITYWQTWGLFILCKILFGGLHRGGDTSRRHWRHRMLERWDKMTPEEREQFRRELDRRVGRIPPEPNAS